MIHLFITVLEQMARQDRQAARTLEEIPEAVNRAAGLKAKAKDRAKAEGADRPGR